MFSQGYGLRGCLAFLHVGIVQLPNSLHPTASIPARAVLTAESSSGA